MVHIDYLILIQETEKWKGDAICPSLVNPDATTKQKGPNGIPLSP